MLIYKVTNLVNGKIYIGQACRTLEERKKKHEYDAQRQDRVTVKFHNALLKYGFENFKWEVIKECETQEELDYYEEYYIQEYQTLDREKGYNLKHGGKLGGCYSEEAKQHMGEATKKKWEDPECAAKMRKGLEKATQTWVELCKERRIKHICPICGKEFYTAKHDSHTYCSIQCANKALLSTKQKYLEKANEVNKANYENKKQDKLDLITEWVKEHSDLLTNIKWNKLTFLNDLCEYIDVKDARTLAKFLGVSNRKDTVKELIKISENIC